MYCNPVTYTIFVDKHAKYIISGQKFFRRKPVRDLLPVKPVSLKVLDPWWTVQVGFVTEDDIKVRRNVGLVFVKIHFMLMFVCLFFLI